MKMNLQGELGRSGSPEVCGIACRYTLFLSREEDRKKRSSRQTFLSNAFFFRAMRGDSFSDTAINCNYLHINQMRGYIGL